MSTDRDVTRIVRSWLEDGATVLPDRVLDDVLDQLPATPQRRSWWPARRLPEMNNALKLTIAAAAVLVVAVIGYRFLPGPNVGGPGPTETPATTSTPSTPPDGSLPEGPFVISDPAPSDNRPSITVTIPAPGWTSAPEVSGLAKGDDADPPEAFMLAWSFPAGTGFYVYGDPCQWASTKPATPATTVDELSAALAAQASRDASAPVDVTVGGYAGKSITLHVPGDLAFSAGEFTDCDEGNFASYSDGTEAGPSRFHQGPGQVDELWILDVDGAFVIIDAMYRPSTPAELIGELRAIAESATFGAP